MFGEDCYAFVACTFPELGVRDIMEIKYVVVLSVCSDASSPHINLTIYVEGRDHARREFMYEGGHDGRRLPLFDVSDQLQKG